MPFDVVAYQMLKKKIGGANMKLVTLSYTTTLQPGMNTTDYQIPLPSGVNALLIKTVRIQPSSASVSFSAKIYDQASNGETVYQSTSINGLLYDNPDVIYQDVDSLNILYLELNNTSSVQSTFTVTIRGIVLN